ncbi:MAG: TonB-dependent receptor plug domain-containing protein [Myxococcales bacterium]|nr:TonB-dependent receptor plug domain-containing protein [Myxococcales bacterium]
MLTLSAGAWLPKAKKRFVILCLTFVASANLALAKTDPVNPTSPSEASSNAELASTPPLSPEMYAGGKGSVRGIIRSAEQPRRFALDEIAVMVTDAEGGVFETLADDSGRFAFENIAVGRARVEASGADDRFGHVEIEVGSDGPTKVEVVIQPIEKLVVTGTGQSRTIELLRSAEAVQVVELQTAQLQSADLGEVLARQQGVSIRRSGGLGSNVRFSLNGLTDDQIRFFLDGVPLDWMGFPFGIGDVPVNLIKHVEIFRGVVPIRFGSDALGGVVNLSSPDPVYAPSLLFSYQTGSFGTHRLTLQGGHLFNDSGLYIRARTFFDRADNDYPVQATVPNPDGRGGSIEATVRRNHDGYAAQGGSIEVGFADVSFADRLSLRTFVTDYTREVQHNATMDVPYGEVELGELSAGAVLRYEKTHDRVELSGVLAYNFSEDWFRDTSECTYDWARMCVAKLGPGEVGSQATDQVRYAHAGMLRFNGEYAVSDDVAVHLSLAPTFFTRVGEERASEALTVLEYPGDLLSFVAGLDATFEAFDKHLQLVVFGKYYLQSLWGSEEVGTEFRPIERLFQRPGGGGSARWLLTERVYLKLSYEWVTRLLRPDEVFGNGALIYPNLDLRPEVGHNANATVTIEELKSPLGTFRGDLNVFFRQPERLVVLLGRGDFFQYYNIFSARASGVEVGGGWTSMGDYVSLDANFSYQDVRNISGQGAFGEYEGDRIPNRPYLLANAIARLQFSDVFFSNDRLTFSYYLRYVDSFFNNWERVARNRPDSKQLIPAQTLHSVAATHVFGMDERVLSTSVEVQNMSDARAFDFFGAQRPGRAVYVKLGIKL